MRQHGFLIETAEMDPEDIINEVDDTNLKEELRSRQHLLVVFELQRTRHKVFIYAIENVNATIVDENLDDFFSNLKRAAKMNLALAFLFKENDGGFRFFYTHENNTMLDRFKLVSTKDDLAKLKDILSKAGVIESCSRERMKTK